MLESRSDFPRKNLGGLKNGTNWLSARKSDWGEIAVSCAWFLKNESSGGFYGMVVRQRQINGLIKADQHRILPIGRTH